MSAIAIPYPKFGAGPSLERIANVAGALGIDLAAFGASGAAIVGSNGKGSTAAMTAAALERTAGPIGLFTSPHLWRLNERFRLGGDDISDEALAHHAGRVADAIAGYEAKHGACFGAFEFLFLIAADWFETRRVPTTIWEAGIGGRLDPVRLIQARRIALTSLDLEHTQLLGPTLEAIACDKLDAAPEGAIAFVSESCRPQATMIETHCRARGVRVEFVAPSVLGAAKPPLTGAFQAENAALAVALARDIAGLTLEAASRDMVGLRWPGRMEVLQREPLIVIDVCHTPRAASAARGAFEALRRHLPATLVCGASVDKEAGALIAALAPGFTDIICTRARHKGASPESIAVHARSANPSANVLVAEDIQAARALLATRTPSPVFVAGGLFLAAEFRAAHSGYDLGGLVFV